MTNREFAEIMYADGRKDGNRHWPVRFADVPEYAVGYAAGEALAQAGVRIDDDKL